MDKEFITQLRDKLRGPLPGYDAHKKMWVIGHHRRVESPANARKAGVMALFIPGENNWELVFIKRSNKYHDDRHKGQIGFPGGKYEEWDSDLMQTALRETEEEIGVTPDRVEVLGKLSNLFIPVSNFMVHPYVGYLSRRPTFKLQESEVADLITCKYTHFFNGKIRNFCDIQVDSGIQLKNVPYFDLNGEVLWGATAMILSELLQIIEE